MPINIWTNRDHVKNIRVELQWSYNGFFQNRQKTNSSSSGVSVLYHRTITVGLELLVERKRTIRRRHHGLWQVQSSPVRTVEKAHREIEDTKAITEISRLGRGRKTTLNHSFLCLNIFNIKKWYQRGLDRAKTKVSRWHVKDGSHISPLLAASCSRAFMRTERCRLQPTWPWARTDGRRSRLLSDSAQVHAAGCQSPSSSYTPAINTLQPPDRLR